VLELDPRIRRAFPEATVVTLYGGSEQRWERGDITLSTTHQLFRFRHAFDLVILDEIDAFPYHGDPMLKYAADKSCLPGAPRLLLSATPPIELQRAAKRGELAHARVPVRYHRHPLPVPILKPSPPVHAILSSGKLPATLQKAIQASLGRGAQLFLFVQKIAQSEPFAALIRDKLQLPPAIVASTSSQDPGRSAKVAAFRTTDIRILVTTTILERGVTIPRSDVIIMDADGKLFDEASLVQMAGRAGRNAADPNGNVYFFAPERNQSQLHAVRHIRTMNRIASARGFLLKPERKRGKQA
jgi:competence protein ComFA